ncbi:MAG: hypothetical protein MPJ50_15700 [Pirellulales bacterium]|nr:hypothetical protein [Pirellulales bacterium]
MDIRAFIKSVNRMLDNQAVVRNARKLDGETAAGAMVQVACESAKRVIEIGERIGGDNVDVVRPVEAARNVLMSNRLGDSGLETEWPNMRVRLSSGTQEAHETDPGAPLTDQEVRRIDVMKIIIKNGTATKAEIVAGLEQLDAYDAVSPSTVEKDLSALSNENLIGNRGPGIGGYFVKPAGGEYLRKASEKTHEV